MPEIPTDQHIGPICGSDRDVLGIHEVYIGNVNSSIVRVSEVYLEDGIPHVEMRREA